MASTTDGKWSIYEEEVLRIYDHQEEVSNSSIARQIVSNYQLDPKEDKF